MAGEEDTQDETVINIMITFVVIINITIVKAIITFVTIIRRLRNTSLPISFLLNHWLLSARFHYLQKSSFNTSSSISSRKSASFRLKHIGGLIFSTLWSGPSVLISTPLSRMRLAR